MSIRIEQSKQINHLGEPVEHLVINDVIWMSNTEDEYVDIERAISTATGRCYIAGLGLGLIIKECSKKERVSIIDVVEIDKEIIKVVAPRFNLERKAKNLWTGKYNNKIIRVFHGDALDPKTLKEIEYSSRTKSPLYDWMYFDIWLEPDEEGQRLMYECFEVSKPYLKKSGVLEAWFKPRLVSGDLWS